MVISWLLDDRPKDLADEYRELIGTAPMLLAFQTLMELRYGALRAGWGELRRRRLERRVGRLTVVQPDDATVTRALSCGSAAGSPAMHWLTSSRWRPMDRCDCNPPRSGALSDDGLFVGTPGLELRRLAQRQ